MSIDQIIRPTGLIDPPVEIRPAKTQVDDLMHEAKEIVKKDTEFLQLHLQKRWPKISLNIFMKAVLK